MESKFKTTHLIVGIITIAACFFISISLFITQMNFPPSPVHSSELSFYQTMTFIFFANFVLSLWSIYSKNKAALWTSFSIFAVFAVMGLIVFIIGGSGSLFNTLF